MGSQPLSPRVKLTNADKVLYPATGTTKRDVLDYYTGIAEVMLPHIAGRPVTRKRWPNGIGRESFFEKQLAPSAPDWLARAEIQHRSRVTTYPIIDTAEGLAWIAQQAALELHVPQWRFVAESGGPGGEVRTPGPATRLVFDLDPGEGVAMPQLAEVARAIRDLMVDIGLAAWPLTSGSKGLHLYVPLDRPVPGQGAVELAKGVARQLQSDMPQLVTATMARNLRAGRVFVDWSQNNAAKTTVAPYSLRGREHPTVAAPRTWAELDDPRLRQLRYDEVLARVARDGDLLAALDPPVRGRDRSVRYRVMREASKTTEPVPGIEPAAVDDHWLVHRMKDQRVFDFAELAPMLAVHGAVANLKPARWAFEGKFDGYRLLVDAGHGAMRLRSRSGRDVTGEFPQLQSLAADLAGHHAVLDGEVVALDASGVPRFGELQNRSRGTRIEFWAFDLLYLDGRSLLRAGYRERRQLLEGLARGTALIVPELLSGDGAAALEQSLERGWEGVVAKQWDSSYRPGSRSKSWIKEKHHKTQEVVIGGWREGEGGRSKGIGSLLVGIPDGGRIRFVGRVGSGFTKRDLAACKEALAPLRTDETPFDTRLRGPDAKGVTFVRPVLVAEVRYTEWTADGRLRQPIWRGLRLDREPRDIRREE